MTAMMSLPLTAGIAPRGQRRCCGGRSGSGERLPASPRGGFLDRLALGGDAWELGHEDAEAALGLRLQHDLVLTLNAHVVKLARP